MNYFRLFDDISYPDRWYLGEINVDESWIFTTGKHVDETKFRDLSIEIDQTGVALDFTETDANAVPIVSEAFAELVYEYMNEVQLIPIVISKTKIPYYILVIKNRIECVDETRSDFQIFEEGNDIRPDLAGEYKVINILKIDAAKVDKHIFRIEKYDIGVIISEELKEKLEAAQLIGLKFKLVS